MYYNIIISLLYPVNSFRFIFSLPDSEPSINHDYRDPESNINLIKMRLIINTGTDTSVHYVATQNLWFALSLRNNIEKVKQAICAKRFRAVKCQ